MQCSGPSSSKHFISIKSDQILKSYILWSRIRQLSQIQDRITLIKIQAFQDCPILNVSALILPVSSSVDMKNNTRKTRDRIAETSIMINDIFQIHNMNCIKKSLWNSIVIKNSESNRVATTEMQLHHQGVLWGAEREVWFQFAEAGSAVFALWPDGSAISALSVSRFSSVS